MVAPVISADGKPFASAFLAILRKQLLSCTSEERRAFRDTNAAELARDSARRLLLVSGPGTGKSYLFLSRILHWLETDPATGVLVTSFVRKLVEDLQRDIDHSDRLTEQQKCQIEVFTLHRLARSLVEQSRGTAAWPFRPGMKIIAGPWPDLVWGDVLAFHPKLSRQEFARKRFSAYLHSNETLDPPRWAPLATTYFRLCQLFNAAGFDDLIVRARDAAVEHPEFLLQSYHVVDEYQDFNPSEASFLRSVLAPSQGVLLAGDDDQVLYEFKGGDPDLIRELYTGPEYANGLLPLCGRCNHHITMAAASFMAAAAEPGRIEKLFVPLTDGVGEERVRMVATTSPAAAVDYVLAWLEQHRSAITARAEDIAAGRQKDPYLLLLAPSKKLKCLGEHKAKFEAAVSALQGAAAPRPPEDYYKTAVYAALGRHPQDSFELRKVLYYQGLTTRAVHRLLAAALEASGLLSQVPSAEVSEALRIAGEVARACAEEPDSQRLATRVAALIPIADVGALAEAITQRPLGASALATLERDEEAAGEQPGAAPSARTLEILSLVGAKGLSADHVLILGCDEHSMDPIGPKAFFVGLTRARISLQCVANLGAMGAADAHGFIYRLPQAHVTYCCYTKQRGLELLAGAAGLRGYFRKVATARASARQRR